MFPTTFPPDGDSCIIRMPTILNCPQAQTPTLTTTPTPTMTNHDHIDSFWHSQMSEKVQDVFSEARLTTVGGVTTN